MPFSNLPEFSDSFSKWLASAGITVFTVFAVLWGRLMWHAEEVRAGRRRFWSRDLLLEGPTVAGMYLVTWGAAEWWSLGPGMASAVGVFLGWLGPRGLRAAIETWLRFREPTKKP